jgi:VanZ family protein
MSLVMTLRLLSRWLAWLLVLAIAVFTLAPVELRPVTIVPANWERFAAYAAMGVAFCLACPQHWLRVVLLVIGMVGMLEVMQNLSPGRQGRLPNGIVKASGALLRVAIGVTVQWMLERIGRSSSLTPGSHDPS